MEEHVKNSPVFFFGRKVNVLYVSSGYYAIRNFRKQVKQVEIGNDSEFIFSIAEMEAFKSKAAPSFKTFNAKKSITQFLQRS